LILKVSCIPLGDVMVSVLATLDPRFADSIPAEVVGGGFLRAINVSSMPSFREEVKPGASCHKIVWHIKELYEV
jgi:hypothetical protein